MCKYAIVDLEMCKVPKSRRNSRFHWSSETIQIGAVLVDENMEIVDEFCTFVHPQFGAIDGYIRSLTGITSYDIKDACEMKDALEQFIKWIPEETICVSWSDSDELQIRHEIEAKDIQLPRIGKLLDTWQDCQKTFSRKMENDKQYRLSEALIATDIMYDEHIHDGLVDAKNTAQLFIKMEKEPKLVLNEYYNKRNDEVQRTTYSLGDMFAKLNVAFA